MATAEVLKFTKSIDDKAKVLIDGTQTNQPSPQSFPNSLCDLATAMLQQSTDETKEAIQQMASEAALALARTGIHDIMILRTNQCRPLPNLNPFFFFFTWLSHKYVPVATSDCKNPTFRSPSWGIPFLSPST